eukprot:TRINITY_DN2436_c0_g1_i1.p1 TRINITY_DN2436_c0_g1~~TRINITY_DN2436_c0_g1_i1.p1  ORF type:complete len:265 (-),score=15.22 TRINITY_DN2436_c0_g1_i1:135-929(-)
MDIHKLLSDSNMHDSPPMKRFQLERPSLNNFNFVKRQEPNFNDIEAAEMMTNMFESSPPPTLPLKKSDEIWSLNGELWRLNDNTNHKAQREGKRKVKSLEGPKVVGDLEKSDMFSVQRGMILGSSAVGPPDSSLFMSVNFHSPPKRCNRTSNKRMVASPSGEPCSNCGTETSTLWRTCEMPTGNSSYLCNACGLRFKKGKYCVLCYKVYYDVDTNQFTWTQCQLCWNWTHKNCLHQRGLNANDLSYTCIQCQRRINHVESHPSS